MNLHLIFKHGSYYMVGDHFDDIIEDSYKIKNPYFSLFKDEKHSVQPGDIIKMG